MTITDTSGNVIEKIGYDIYGRLTALWVDGTGDIMPVNGLISPASYYSSSLTKNPRLFQGRDLDEETGLYYFRNRQYDPVHGRFLSRDPAGYHDSFSLYQFVNNNPVCYVDPEGKYVASTDADNVFVAMNGCPPKVGDTYCWEDEWWDNSSVIFDWGSYWGMKRCIQYTYFGKFQKGKLCGEVMIVKDELLYWKLVLKGVHPARDITGEARIGYDYHWAVVSDDWCKDDCEIWGRQQAILKYVRKPRYHYNAGVVPNVISVYTRKVYFYNKAGETYPNP